MRGRRFGPSAGCWLLVISLLLALASPVPAQDTGQVCVQSFIDRDADGTRGAEERTARHGVSASLHNAAGVTIASRLLDDSPFAADGLLCFDDLLAGDYRITLRSSEFASTTEAAFSASARPGAAPMVLEFGLQPLSLSRPSRSPTAIAADANAVLPLLLGGALLAVILCVICLLLVFIIFRRRSKGAPAMSYRAPISAKPGADGPRKHNPSAGSPPLFAADDLDAPGAN